MSLIIVQVPEVTAVDVVVAVVEVVAEAEVGEEALVLPLLLNLPLLLLRGMNSWFKSGRFVARSNFPSIFRILCLTHRLRVFGSDLMDVLMGLSG